MAPVIDGEHWLDSVAKSLARGSSRRAFLGLLGSSALALLAPAPRSGAQALRPCWAGCTDPTFPHCCDGYCTNFAFDVAHCGACGERCGPGQICRQGRCLTPDPPGPLCDPPCGADEVCKYSLDQDRIVCCRPDHVCGDRCHDVPKVRCTEGEACCDPAQVCCQYHCCEPGETCCETTCCAPGHTCLPGDPDDLTGDPCCPSDRVCAGTCCRGQSECVDGSCWPKCDCPAGQRCLDTGGLPWDGGLVAAPPVCCPPAQVWELGTYSSREGRISRGMCCAEEHRWIRPFLSGEDYLCCPPQNRWVGGLCCPPEHRWGPASCCPPPDRWEGPGLCCPPERRCGADQRICCREYERCNPDGICEACPPLDLNGLWEDNGRRVRIVHRGERVTATYVVPHTCHHQDGTGGSSRTTLDFNATLRCLTLTGETTVCRYGPGTNPGFILSPVTLTASPDGTSLSGRWRNDMGSGSMTLIRLQDRPGSTGPSRTR
jgi:hypothetical protein